MTEKKYSRQRKNDSNKEMEAVASELGNRPPSAVDIEMAIIGAMLIDCDSCMDQIEELNEECFYDRRCRLVFNTIKDMVAHKKPVDCLTVTQTLTDMNELESIGGVTWIVDLTNKIGSLIHNEYYSKILLEKRVQRNLIKAAYRIIKDVFSENISLDLLIANAQSAILAASDVGIRKDTKHVMDIIDRTVEKIEKAQTATGITGVPSGYQSLDRLTMGWQNGNLIILGARPGVGKTAFALNLARNAAVMFSKRVAFFTLEMQDVEILQRLLITESGIPGSKISGRNKMDGTDWGVLEHAITRLAQANIFIDDTPCIPITEFASKAKHLVIEKGVEMIFVDYLQLMKGESNAHGFREQEVASISRTLKGLAKELDIPIMALSQLSRGVMNRAGSNGRPMLSDLRESGAIEQDADIVMFIHRPDALGLMDENASDNNSEVIIAKHRNGELANIPMRYVGSQVKFYDDSVYDWDASAFIERGSKLNHASVQEEYSPFNDFHDSGWQPSEEFQYDAKR